MKIVLFLLEYLVCCYYGWCVIFYVENVVWFCCFVEEGQCFCIMVIFCCDSCVNIIYIFGVDQGEFFMYCNIVNFVLLYNLDGDYYGILVVIEYGVIVLNVVNLIVVGYLQCGGVVGCDVMCNGYVFEFEVKMFFVGMWLNMLCLGYECVKDLFDEECLIVLEKEGVIVSLENFVIFLFIFEWIVDGCLVLYGLWKNIVDGIIEGYDFEKGVFVLL